MICSRCGHQNDKKATVCIKCGNRLLDISVNDTIPFVQNSAPSEPPIIQSPPQSSPKKDKAVLIAGIVSGVFALIVIMIVIIIAVSGSSDGLQQTSTGDGSLISDIDTYSSFCDTNNYLEYYDNIFFAVMNDGTVNSTVYTGWETAEEGTQICKYELSYDLSSWNNIKSIKAAGGADHFIVGLREDGTCAIQFADQKILEVSDDYSEYAYKDHPFEGNYRDSDRSATSYESIESWTDIADIYIGCDGIIGLKTDGTIVYAPTIYNGTNFAEYLEKTKSWTDITSIAYEYRIIYGAKKDGSVVMAKSDYMDEDEYNAVYADVINWTDIDRFVDGTAIGIKNDGTMVSIFKSNLNHLYDGINDELLQEIGEDNYEICEKATYEFVEKVNNMKDIKTMSQCVYINGSCKDYINNMHDVNDFMGMECGGICFGIDKNNNLIYEATGYGVYSTDKIVANIENKLSGINKAVDICTVDISTEYYQLGVGVGVVFLLPDGTLRSICFSDDKIDAPNWTGIKTHP